MANLRTTEIARTFQILPFEIVYVDHAVAVRVVRQRENLAANSRLFCAKTRILRFKERGLPIGFEMFALLCKASADEFLESQFCKLRREIACEIARLGIVAGYQHRLAAEHIGVVFEVSTHFYLNIMILRVEFVVLCRLGVREVLVGHRT